MFFLSDTSILFNNIKCAAKGTGTPDLLYKIILIKYMFNFINCINRLQKCKIKINVFTIV